MTHVRGAAILAAAAALVAAGCVSNKASAEAKAVRADGFTVCESQFMRTGPMDDSAACNLESPSRSAQPAHVLTPDAPWIGTVGVTTSLSDSMRLGLGIEVPNPNDRRAATIPIQDRLRETGVGAWVSWDF